MKKIYAALTMLPLLCGMASTSQTITYPAPFALSTGSYQFSNWPSTAAPGTYPMNMRFYRLDTTSDPLLVNEIYTDYDTFYNLTAGTRITGLGDNGFSFLNTSTAVKKLGAAIVSLNTVGRTAITVQWTGTTVTPNLREYEIRLFWRVGNSAAWLPVISALGDTIRYVRSDNAGDSLVLGPVTLPAGANGQPEVQLEWKYFLTAGNMATGARAELGISHISITSSGAAFPVVATSAPSLSTFAARANQSSAPDSFTVSGNTLTGDVTATVAAPFEVSLNATTWSNAVTLAQSGGTIAATQVYVRFSPVAQGIFTGNVSLSTAGGATQQVSVMGYTIQSSNPVPFTVTSGTYNFSQWDSLSAPGTYPSNMVFQTTNELMAPLTYLPLPADWTCGYNVPTRPRFKGLDTLGVSFLNTGAPQYDYCDTLTATSTQNIFTGAAVLALHTSGATNILVGYNAGLITYDTASSVPRVYNLRLQFRADSVSSFQDVAPLSEYTSAGHAFGNLQHFALMLPAALENKPYIQLRWLYYAATVAGSTGSRPEIRLDNVTVSGSALLAQGVAGAHTANGVYPTPAHSGDLLHFLQPFTGAAYDGQGRKMCVLSGATECSTAGWSTGIYLLRSEGGAAIRIAVIN